MNPKNHPDNLHGSVHVSDNCSTLVFFLVCFSPFYKVAGYTGTLLGGGLQQIMWLEGEGEAFVSRLLNGIHI